MHRLALALSSLAIALVACSDATTTRAAVAAPPDAGTTEQTTEVPPEDVPDGGVSREDAGRPPSGCGKVASGAGKVTARTVTAKGKTRTFHVSIPGAYDASSPAPLVVVLHGATDETPQHMKEWFAVEAAVPRSIGVYPQALRRTHADGSGGNVTRWDLDGDEDLLFFDAMLADLAATLCVDRARVFATGFSSGGNFAHQLGCLRAGVVRAIAPVAGPGPFESGCAKPMAVWMTHDANDDALPVAGARSSRDFWSDRNGCRGTWQADPKHAACRRDVSCPAATPLVYCETSGVGHDVPAFAPAAIGAFLDGFPGTPGP